jgi:YVTN family beta-propeller protein
MRAPVQQWHTKIRLQSLLDTPSVGAWPQGDAADPRTGTIYVADQEADRLAVIDGLTNTVVTRVLVGADPYGVALWHHGQAIYVTNQDAGTVSVMTRVQPQR